MMLHAVVLCEAFSNCSTVQCLLLLDCMRLTCSMQKLTCCKRCNIHLPTQALGMRSTSQDTPMHGGLQTLGSAGLTPGFMDFANKVGAHITMDEADDFLRPAIDDTTTVLVPVADLARAGAYTYDSSPLFVPGANSTPASRASPQPGAGVSGATSPPALSTLVQSMLQHEAAGATPTMVLQAGGEELPVDASQVELQLLPSGRDADRSPSAPPEDFYGIEGQTTELNLRGRWGDDATATFALGAYQAKEGMLELGEGSNTAAPTGAATVAAGEEEPAGDAGHAAAEAIQHDDDAALPSLPAAEVQQLAGGPAAVQQDPQAESLAVAPAAADDSAEAVMPEEQALSPSEAPATDIEPPAPSDSTAAAIASPTREQVPVVTAAEGAFGTPIAVVPTEGQTSQPSSPSGPSPAAASPQPTTTQPADTPAASVPSLASPAADAASTDYAAADGKGSTAPAVPEPMVLEDTPDDAAAAGTDDAAGSTPTSICAHMISAEASEVDAEGNGSETPSTLPSPMAAATSQSLDVNMPDVPAQEDASSAQLASDAGMPAAVTAQAEEVLDQVHAPAVPSFHAEGQAADVQAAQPAEAADDAGVAGSQDTNKPAMKVSASAQPLQQAAVDMEEMVPELQAQQQQQAEEGAVQPIEPQRLLHSAKAGDTAMQPEVQHDSSQAEQAPEAKQPPGAQAAEAQAPTAAEQHTPERIEQRAEVPADPAVQGLQLEDAPQQQQHQQQQQQLPTEASEQDMALMADATDVPLQLEDSLGAFPGLQTTASPELPGGPGCTSSALHAPVLHGCKQALQCQRVHREPIHTATRV